MRVIGDRRTAQPGAAFSPSTESWVLKLSWLPSLIVCLTASLIEYEWIHRKVSNFGIQGKIFSLLFGGKLFVAVKVWYPMKQKVGSEFFMYKKKFSDIYDTYALFSAPSENI